MEMLMAADYDRVKQELDLRVDVIINTAALTNVDRCEVEREQAWKTNVVIVERLARYCLLNTIKLVQCSTDNVFDGQDGPYDEKAGTHPVNYYGRTKLAAENLCRATEIESLIVRTMWLYGSTTRLAFVEWLVAEMKAGKAVKVAYDEVGNPTHYEDLAWGIIAAIERNVRGTLHLAGRERMTRLEMAQLITDRLKLDATLLVPVTSAELQRAAKRPLNSGLISTRAVSDVGYQARSLGECIRSGGWN